jgi:hypothetical protein
LIAESKPKKWRSIKNVEREARRAFRNKEREYFKHKINDFQRNCKNKNK